MVFGNGWGLSRRLELVLSPQPLPTLIFHVKVRRLCISPVLPVTSVAFPWTPCTFLSTRLPPPRHVCSSVAPHRLASPSVNKSAPPSTLCGLCCPHRVCSASVAFRWTPCTFPTTLLPPSERYTAHIQPPNRFHVPRSPNLFSVGHARPLSPPARLQRLRRVPMDPLHVLNHTFATIRALHRSRRAANRFRLLLLPQPFLHRPCTHYVLPTTIVPPQVRLAGPLTFPTTLFATAWAPLRSYIAPSLPSLHAPRVAAVRALILSAVPLHHLP